MPDDMDDISATKMTRGGPSASLVWRGLGATAGVLFFTLSPRLVMGQPIEDANRKLFDMDERVKGMAADFRETPTLDPNVADRRVIEAQTLYELKNYGEAATVLLDVIEKYPNSTSYGDAVYLLAESLYQDRDFNSSRRYFQMVIKRGGTSRQEQGSLQRLVELALRTGDYENVDDYLSRLEKIPPDALEPSVPYVRGKYLYFRNRNDEALATFAAIPPANPYYLQARYFLATIQVKNKDLAAAATAFDSVVKAQPRNESDRDIQDLARLAIGRILYERGQFDKAKEAYASVSRDSKSFGDAMYESAWNFIRAKDFKQAYRALDLMLLQNPDSSQAPELRLLMGNLNLRMANFFVASEAFSQTRDEFEPVFEQLKAMMAKSKADPGYFDGLVGKGMERFDIALFVPAGATKFVKAEPEVARMLVLAEDVGSLQRGLKDSEQTVVRLEKAVNGEGRVGIFPDLASLRTKSVEILNQTVDIRRRFVAQVRGMATPFLTLEEKAALDRLEADRTRLEQDLQTLPLTADALSVRERSNKSQVMALDAQASEANVMIQAMDAELVAIEQYYITSRSDQKIRPEDLQRPVADLRNEIAALRAGEERLRDDIAEAARDSGAAGAAGESDRSGVVMLGELMKKEQDIFLQARARMSPSAQQELDTVSAVLGRADTVQSHLFDFDARVDAAADKRLVTLKERLATEKVELADASGKLTGVLSESQNVGGGFAQGMLAKVTDRFYDITVQSDVGLIDVSWGLKDQKTGNLSKLINQQKLELKSVEDDFKSLLQEEK